MNINYRRLETAFGPEARFDLLPAPAAPFRAVQESGFERLKNRLLNEHLGKAWEPLQASGIRRAAHEAEALAWITPYPLLVFPALFDEKADAARQRAQHQAAVYRRSRRLVPA